jgi:hypothetical protein
MKELFNLHLDDRMIRILKIIQWDLLSIAAMVILLLLVRILTMGSMHPAQVSHSLTTFASSDPHFSYSSSDIKHYSYDSKRDIFNFADNRDTEQGPPQQIPFQQKQEFTREATPIFKYQGLITSGEKKITALVVNNSEYIVSEEDIIDHRYKLMKITSNALILYDMLERKNIEIKKTEAYDTQ